MIRFVQGLVLLFALGWTSACGTQAPVAHPPQSSAISASAPLRELGVEELKAKLDTGVPVVVLDVRSPEEYQQDGHIVGSQLIPLPELEQRLDEVPAGRPIACICRSGNRSQTACALLAQRGFTDVASVQGGMRAWIAAGYPSQ